MLLLTSLFARVKDVSTYKTLVAPIFAISFSYNTIYNYSNTNDIEIV